MFVSVLVARLQMLVWLHLRHLEALSRRCLLLQPSHPLDSIPPRPSRRGSVLARAKASQVPARPQASQLSQILHPFHLVVVVVANQISTLVDLALLHLPPRTTLLLPILLALITLPLPSQPKIRHSHSVGLEALNLLLKLLKLLPFLSVLSSLRAHRLALICSASLPQTTLAQTLAQIRCKCHRMPNPKALPIHHPLSRIETSLGTLRPPICFHLNQQLRPHLRQPTHSVA